MLWRRLQATRRDEGRRLSLIGGHQEWRVGGTRVGGVGTRCGQMDLMRREWTACGQMKAGRQMGWGQTG